MAIDAVVEVSKSIIKEFHRHFADESVDNFEHVLAVKRIVKATCHHFPNKTSEIEKELLDHAFDLFSQEWLGLAAEDEEDYDKEEELEEARRVSFQIYETEKKVW